MVWSSALLGLTDLRAWCSQGLTTAFFWASVRPANSSLTRSSATGLETRGMGLRSAARVLPGRNREVDPAVRAAPPRANVRMNPRRSRASHSGQGGEVFSCMEGSCAVWDEARRQGASVKINGTPLRRGRGVLFWEILRVGAGVLLRIFYDNGSEPARSPPCPMSTFVAGHLSCEDANAHSSVPR